MRLLTVMMAVLVLGGCAEAVENPRTGERLSCSEGILDLSPWSQSDSCTANHIAEGWVVVASHESATP